jgi:hypothetical protein
VSALRWAAFDFYRSNAFGADDECCRNDLPTIRVNIEARDAALAVSGRMII